MFERISRRRWVKKTSRLKTQTREIGAKTLLGEDACLYLSLLCCMAIIARYSLWSTKSLAENQLAVHFLPVKAWSVLTP